MFEGPSAKNQSRCSALFFKNSVLKFFFFLIFYFFIYGCAGSSLLQELLLYLQCSGFSLWWLLLSWSIGFKCAGLSSWDSQALQHRFSSCGPCTGFVAQWPVGSSWTRDRTSVSSISRWILYQRASREALGILAFKHIRLFNPPNHLVR